MNNIVSVIIPVGQNEKKSSYMRTIKSLIETSKEEIEILFLADGWKPNLEDFTKHTKVLPSTNNLGERGTVNRGVALAKGDYVLKIDAHCKMSPSWDVELKKSCGKNNLVVCTLDALKEDNWESLNHNYTYVYVNSSMEEKWWGNYHSDDKNKDVQPTMSLTGCGWFCRRKYFLSHLKYDKDLGKWGSIGPEMSAKVEKSGGEILLHKKVKCCHLFSTNPTGYPVSVVVRARKKILERYGKYLFNLSKKFKPVPTWDKIKNLNEMENNLMYETDVVKKDEIEKKNTKGEVIEKIIKYYQPIHYKGKENPDDPEVGQKITQNAKIEKIKIAKLINEKWVFEVIEQKNQIDLWLFENE